MIRRTYVETIRLLWWFSEKAEELVRRSETEAPRAIRWQNVSDCNYSRKRILSADAIFRDYEAADSYGSSARQSLRQRD